MSMKTFKGTLTVTKQMYEALLECASAENGRDYMSHTYYDKSNNNIVATDGRRCIIYPMGELDLTEGHYSPIKQGKEYKLIPIECDGVFPNYKRIVVEPTEETKMVNSSNVHGRKEEFVYGAYGYTGNLCKDSSFICKLIKETRCTINLANLKPLKGTEFHVYSNGQNKAMLFKAETFDYIVMPM